jgi:hypothetical protein
MQQVFTTTQPMEAHFVRNLLEAEGIHAVVMGEMLFTLQVPFQNSTLPSVWVDEHQAEEARVFVADYEKRKQPHPETGDEPPKPE